MGHRRSATYWFNLFGAAGLVLAALAGCSGDDGSAGASGSNAVATVPATSSTNTALNLTITGASINSAPVVHFSVSNQYGQPVTGFADTDFRINISKLMPGAAGSPAGSYNWQSYLNRVDDAGVGVVGSQERKASGAAWGTLVSHGNGTYTYTFATDITNPAANPCPAPCNDIAGNALDISYQPNLTHRVGIQFSNTALPRANATYDFVPAGGAVTARRDIVKTASCNACHNPLAAHGGAHRVETNLCVTCHNPGSWDGTPGNPPQTIDFKVMIHKIHMGEELPSVVAGGTYVVAGADFSTVVFPMAGSSAVGELRHCTKCHDGADPATPQGDNWKTQPSMEVCSSCHDNVYFGATPDAAKPYQTVAHKDFPAGAGTVGVLSDNSTCLTCHGAGQVEDIAVKHDFPARLNAAADSFKLTIVDATPTGPGDTPTITFKIEKDGVGLANFRSDPAFTGGGASTLNMRLAWSTTDIGNVGSGQNYGQPATINLITAPSVAAGATAGTYTVTGNTIPVGATGSLRVFMDGHPAGDVTTAGTFTDRLPVKSVYKDFKITDTTVVARRTVVDIVKCDSCHNRVNLHGNNRNNEPGVCINCHNPNATDKSRRPAGAPAGTPDNKAEESIDFKRMIHAIHAGQKDDPSTTTVVEGYGVRENGIVVYGFGGSANDYSQVRFPGTLNDCSKCHVTGTTSTYELAGRWVEPSQSGILGSTVNTSTLTNDATDDLKISPTAAVCSSCHDSGSAQDHMVTAGGAIGVGSVPADTQANLALNYETCAVCHAPGKLADVKVVHGIK